jgi:hypothetical protein
MPARAQVLEAQQRALDSGDASLGWRCPCCREICNCSGSNCQRARRQLEFTNILIHEAQHLGYKSVGGGCCCQAALHLQHTASAEQRKAPNLAGPHSLLLCRRAASGDGPRAGAERAGAMGPAPGAPL